MDVIPLNGYSVLQVDVERFVPDKLLDGLEEVRGFE
jgi:hypothetical protein